MKEKHLKYVFPEKSNVPFDLALLHLVHFPNFRFLPLFKLSLEHISIHQNQFPLALFLALFKPSFIDIPIRIIQTPVPMHFIFLPLAVISLPILPNILSPARLLPQLERTNKLRPIAPNFGPQPVAVPFLPVALVRHFLGRVLAVAFELVVEEVALVSVPVWIFDDAEAVALFVGELAAVNCPVHVLDSVDFESVEEFLGFVEFFDCFVCI